MSTPPGGGPHGWVVERAEAAIGGQWRHHTRTDGLHDYRVGINPTGNHALQACLPPQLFDTYLATCARSPRYFNALTELVGDMT